MGPNTHFFTILPNECQDVKNNPLWIFEGLVFRTEGPDATGACAANRVPVIRMGSYRVVFITSVVFCGVGSACFWLARRRTP